MLKFEGKFVKGQRIRAYEFQPRPGVGPCYHEGTVVNENTLARGAQVYVIVATKHVWCGEEQPDDVGDTIFVPHEIAMRDWDGRIELVQEGA